MGSYKDMGRYAWVIVKEKSFEKPEKRFCGGFDIGKKLYMHKLLLQNKEV